MAIEVLEIEFPLPVSYNTRGGPEFRTQINTLNSGAEDALALWDRPRWRYEVVVGRKALEDLNELEAFFVRVRGRFHGFLLRDPVAMTTALSPDAAIAATDQPIGTGDAAETVFPLVVSSDVGGVPYARRITRPDAGALVSVDGVLQESGISIDALGRAVFAAPPADGAAIAAGFTYRVAVRFDADWMPNTYSGFLQGEPVRLAMVEIREDL
ncbi:MAG: DUF2460 domain-containing protein [Pseudomonadota bacterium]